MYEVFGTDAELKEFRSDYNHLGMDLTAVNAHLEKADPGLWQKIQTEAFKTSYLPHIIRTASKRRVNDYETLKDWQAVSGQDTHSIFADALYANPLPPMDRWDWRVRPGNPNIGKGENGADMGAVGAVE